MLAVILGIFSLCWAIVGALFASLVPGGASTFVALAFLLTGLPLGLFIWIRTHGGYPGAPFRLLVMRPFWYAQLTLLLSGLVGAVVGLAASPFGAAQSAGRWAVALTAGACVLLSIIGYFGSRRLLVRHMTATIAGLPPAFDGLRITHISDTHVGPHTSRRHLARVRAAVEKSEPAMIAVTGDLVDDHAADVAHYAETLGGLAAPLGVYAIPGNHEVYAGWVAVRDALGEVALTVLVNEARILDYRGERLAVVGLGDPAAGRHPSPSLPAPDVDAALASVPHGTVTVALAHNPALWPALAARGVSLTLSGHTHWAQLALPWRGWSLANVFLELAMGVYQRGEALLYIHPGTNYWGIPFRIGALPEVAVITLRTGNASAMSGPRDRRASASGRRRGS
ncbi:MAG TPA: metallophosphoesterase [Gemmatimonadaceae bacterium]|nr:metallophosphoesterase [Gemmatimonadaceae bacterium]